MHCSGDRNAFYFPVKLHSWPFTIITLGQSFNFKAEDERGEDANMRNAVFLSRKLGLAAAAGQARGGQVDRVKISLRI